MKVYLIVMTDEDFVAHDGYGSTSSVEAVCINEELAKLHIKTHYAGFKYRKAMPEHGINERWERHDEYDGQTLTIEEMDVIGG